MTTYGWVDETKWDDAVSKDVPDTERDPFLFMTTEGIDRKAFGEALREYRNLDSAYIHDSPWDDDDLNVLSTDFINWYRWERL